MGYFNRVPYALLGGNSRTWVLASFAFAKFVQRLSRSSGTRGLAMYLKTCQILLMKYVSGDKVPNSRTYGVAVAMSGRIPSLIPKDHRKEIRRGNRSVIRFWMTLFGLYRILPFKGRMKISTITDPGKDFNIIPYVDFLPFFLARLHQKVEFGDPRRFSPKLILKSGPGSSQARGSHTPNSSSLIVPYSVAMKQSHLWSGLSKLARLITPGLVDRLTAITRYAPPANFPKTASFPIGKLGVKQEPGKVRVFAMVDWWTQMLLLPLHRHIQGILRKIPQDATFDQDAAVVASLEMSRKATYAASFDLSAATDRLPLVLQSMLMNSIIPGHGQLWGELLVDRDYWLPGYRKSVRYSVGQPMGALSSWVMLALTHHFIVQMAAFRAGHVRWFPLYSVLGDDVVIFDEAVANQYLNIMRDLGLDINLSKSVVSRNGSFEFAKRFIVQGQDLSALSFKELDVAMLSLDAMALLLKRFGGPSWKLSNMFRILGFGHRSLAHLNGKLSKITPRLRLAIVWLTKPGVSRWSFSSYIEWLSMKSLSGTNPNILHKENIWESLNARIQAIAPSGLDDSWAPTSGYADGKGISDFGSYTKTFGEGWKAEEVEKDFNALLSVLSYDHQIALREQSNWFKANDPREGHSEITFELLERSIIFYEDWLKEVAALPRAEVDLSTRKEKAGLRLVAGRWLRLWTVLRR